MKLGLILSNDWEVFGDGTGDYFEVQHKPLEGMLDIVEGYGAKVTVMAEVGQQWGHRDLGRTQPWAAKVADAWEGIVRDTVRRKSDVQLHLHPQWLNATYDGSKWRLHLENWAIASLPPEGIEAALRRGKEYLEGVIRPVDPSYECIAFRAGAYGLEPSSKVIPALRKTGILCDSSVTKGMTDREFFDYRDAHSNVLPWMTSRTSVKNQGVGGEGLLEIPIYSFPMIDSMALWAALGKERAQRLFYKLNFKVGVESIDQKWIEERIRVMNERYPPAKRPYTSPAAKIRKYIRSPSWLASALISRQFVQLDYDYIPPGVFVKAMRQIINQHEKNQDSHDVIIPVMSSGHVKNMHSGQNLDRILAAVSREFKDLVVYWTLREAVDYWRSRLRPAN